MRILFPTSEFPPFPGGVSRLALEQAVGLGRLRNEVLVYTLGAGPEGTLENGVTVARRASRGIPILRLGGLATGLVRMTGRFKPEFIHTPTYRGFGLPLLAAAQLSRVKYSVYLHGTELQTEQRNAARLHILKRVLSGAAFVGTNSSNTRGIVLSLFPRLEKRTHVIPPGVDTAKLMSAETILKGEVLRREWMAGSSPDTVFLLSVCRANRQKGIDLVLRSVARHNNAGEKPPLKYVMCGEGPDLEDFRSMARALNITEHVEFRGAVDPEDVFAYYSACDIYVQPSQPVGDFLESFGIAFVEAQAAGKPCIGTNWGGVPEAVDADNSAFLVPTGDEDAVANRIALLAADAQLRARMGEAGQRYASQFTWASHAKKLEQLIAENK